jgi:N-acetylneuraminate synthase
MTPEEFAALVQEGTSAFQSLGVADWRIQDSERESRRLRRSLYLVKDVKEGELVSHQNVRPIRPGGGCPPKYIDNLIGKRFKKSQSVGTPMSEDLVN